MDDQRDDQRDEFETDKRVYRKAKTPEKPDSTHNCLKYFGNSN